MKPHQARELIKSIKERGWIEHENVFYTPAAAEKLNLVAPKKATRKKPGIKTGDKQDYRNIKNKDQHIDSFIRLVRLELGVELWPEFYFTIDRQWRFDYCLPDHMIYIEVEGGIFTGGRHTRGTGFKGDMEKYNRAASMGWRMIRFTPTELLSDSAIEMIKKTILSK